MNCVSRLFRCSRVLRWPELPFCLKKCAYSAALMCAAGWFAAAPATADEIRPEVRVIDGVKQTVYTNSGNDAYRNSVRSKDGVTVISGSSYPVYTGKKKTSAPRRSSGAKISNAVKANAQRRQGLRPDGTAEFAPPQYQTIVKRQPVPRAASYRSNWAFATFDAKKRLPNIVSYYGWDRSNPSQNQRTWVDVDLNPIILKYSKIWGVDPLLIEIIICHESNFNPTAVSPVGALGLMQLMPDTAAGLGINDAFDVEQNIAGGTRYVASMLERFNSVPLALAAYNAGPGAVLEYGGVPPYSETRYYVDTIYGEYLAGKHAREKGKR